MNENIAEALGMAVEGITSNFNYECVNCKNTNTFNHFPTVINISKDGNLRRTHNCPRCGTTHECIIQIFVTITKSDSDEQ